MRALKIEPLEPEAFAPYGDVLTPPDASGRAWFDGSLSSLRKGARPSLSIVRVETAGVLPLQARRMERHEYSSQSFVPLGSGRILILVAPHAPEGGPDMGAARTFLADEGVGVTYAADVWHHPLTLLSAPASLAVFMWREGGPSDEEFVDIEPLLLRSETDAG